MTGGCQASGDRPWPSTRLTGLTMAAGVTATRLQKAVAHAGGWDDVGTMLRCYDHPEDADILAVTSETRKWREVAMATSDVATT